MTAETPWHLDALGLPAHADRTAVRRAYAALLRQIDPATDPQAFATLREAYEAARAWCDTAAEAAPLDTPPAADAEDSEPAPPLHTMPDDVAGTDTAGAAHGAVPQPAPPLFDATITLAWRFAADVGARRPEQAGALLADTLAEVRTQYIDAPGRFEEHLIDLIGLQRIGHRAAVFAAAEEQCHWHEVGHLVALGQRGQWIEAVLAQREAWSLLAPDRRHAWIDLFERAETRLDTSLLKDWPDMATLHARYPAWITLHVSTETLQAWQAMFEAQTASAREVFTKMASPASAYLPASVAVVRQRERRRGMSLLIGSLVVAALLGMGQIVNTRHAQAPFHLGRSTPDTPAQCADLYRRLDRPDALKGLSTGDMDQLKHRADRCASTGDWHPPTLMH